MTTISVVIMKKTQEKGHERQKQLTEGVAILKEATPPTEQPRQSETAV